MIEFGCLGHLIFKILLKSDIDFIYLALRF